MFHIRRSFDRLRFFSYPPAILLMPEWRDWYPNRSFANMSAEKLLLLRAFIRVVSRRKVIFGKVAIPHASLYNSLDPFLNNFYNL